MKTALLCLLPLMASAASPAKPGEPRPEQDAAARRLCDEARQDKLYPALLIEEEKRAPGTLSAEEAEALVPYFACRTIAGSEKPCGVLGVFAAQGGYLRRQCQREALSGRLIAAVLAGKPARDLCRQFVEVGGVEIFPGKAEAFCEVYERSLSSGKASCPDLATIFPAKRLERCEQNTVYVRGEPSLCPSGGKLFEQECRRMAGLIGGLKRSGPACERSPYCGAVTVGPERCETLGRAALAIFRKRMQIDKICGIGPNQTEDSAAIRARRDAEEAGWETKTAVDKARMKLEEESKLKKVEDKRKAEEAKNKKRDVDAERRKREDAAQYAGTHDYEEGEPMNLPDKAPKPTPPGGGQR